MQNFFRGVVACCVLCASAVVMAETDDELLAMSLETLATLQVRIATGTPKSLAETPAATSVITARELEAMGAQDIGEALEMVPGLHVSNGSFQYAPRYFIRGIVSTYNPHTLVLVNGIPQTSLLLGDRGERLPALYSLPVKLIERIEIIRGPGSALYGADAFAGVINLITKGPGDADGTQVSVSGGSFDTRRSSVVKAASLGPIRSVTSLAWMQTKGDRSAIITSDLQSNIDALAPGFPPASLAPGPAETSARDYDLRTDLIWGDFRLRVGWMRAWDTGTGQGIDDALDPSSRFIHHRGNVDLTWRDPGLFQEWILETRLSYLYGDFVNPGFIKLFPPGAFFGSFPDGVTGSPNLNEQNARADLTALYSGAENHRLRLGSGFFWGDIFETKDVNNYLLLPGVPFPVPRSGFTDVSDTPGIFQPEKRRSSHYAFAQDEWTFAPDWELTAGLRYDRYSDVGSTTNPRLALVWQTLPTLTSKLIYGEAFRPPAFFELYGTNNPVALGNPGLKPEKLRSLELALCWKPTTHLAWDINFYEFHIRDFIDFVSDDSSQTTFTAQNTGHIKGSGVETELRQQVSNRLQLLANYSHQQTRDTNNGKPLGIAPSDKANLRAVWEWASQWELTPQLVWVGERQRQAGDPRPALAGYTAFNLSVRKRWQPHFDMALIGRNIFNADVREPSRGPGPRQTAPALAYDLPQAGRSIMLEANLHW